LVSTLPAASVAAPISLLAPVALSRDQLLSAATQWIFAPASMAAPVAGWIEHRGGMRLAQGEFPGAEMALHRLQRKC
jgi:hypothetical protein